MSEESLERKGDTLSRRALLCRATAGGAMLALPGLLAACGSSSGGAGTTAAASTDALGVSAGADIPRTTVKFGMAPFIDASAYVIGVQRGWFDEVGITLGPGRYGLPITPENVVSKLVTGEADLATVYAPGVIANMHQTPQIKMIGLSDLFTGSFLLAPPDANVKRVSELVDSGTPFSDAIKEVMQQIRGKQVAVNNRGQQRAFIDGIFRLGGVSFDDVKLTASTDAQILALARGGQIDFAILDGAAQIVELLAGGWVPIVTATDLLDGLPPGDPLSVSGIGHEGPALTEDYYEKNKETCLRFLSVMFRMIDAVVADPAQVARDQAAYFASRAGAATPPEQMVQTYKAIYHFIPFKEQPEVWGNGPRSAQKIYSAQIAQAEKGGLLPAGKGYTPDDAIIGGDLYRQLVTLKKGYDDLVGEAKGLDGRKGDLARQAAQQYEHYNYLDAYRMLKTATQS